jgi:hypothetical protein
MTHKDSVYILQLSATPHARLEFFTVILKWIHLFCNMVSCVELSSQWFVSSETWHCLCHLVSVAHHVPEAVNLQQHCCGNLKFCMVNKIVTDVMEELAVSIFRVHSTQSHFSAHYNLCTASSALQRVTGQWCIGI